MERAPTTEATEVWREPARGGYPNPAGLELNGLERLAALRTDPSIAPPLFHLTGSRPTRFAAGTADAEMPTSGWLVNAAGVIGGGVLAIVADIAFGCAVQTELPPRVPYTTAELSLSFLRPLHPNGSVTASGQAIHVGRSVGLAEAFVIAEEGERLIAHGSSRLSILRQSRRCRPSTIRRWPRPGRRIRPIRTFASPRARRCREPRGSRCPARRYSRGCSPASSSGRRSRA